MPRLCLMIEGQEGVTWPQWLALADAAERLGFEALFTSDHYGSVLADEERGALDVWGVLNALAARTERIRLGTLVSPVTYRAPAVLARLALTVDQISGGRVEVGMGAGWHAREHAAFGFPFPPLGTRMELLEEQTALVRAFLDGEDVEFDGAHYQVVHGRLLPRPLQARVPLLLGGGAKRRTAALAARFADEYNLVLVDPDECRAGRERLDRACAEVDRDPATLPTSLMTRCIVGRDDADYRARLARVCARTGEDPATIEADEGGAWIIGTPARALERIAAYRAAGIQRFMLQHLVHDDLEQLEIIAGEVAPHLG